MRMCMYGLIFSIEEFSIHDGPGIRTTIFLKGCPLHCTWCHNPEGISPLPQVMNKKNGEKAISGNKISSDELAKLILKNKDIYQLNAGGVTFTGGEPLLQSSFIAEVLHKIKPHIHTAIETSGYSKPEVFERIIPMFDLVLMDIKHTDPGIHKKYTGVDNKIIMHNLKFLCKSETEFIIRIPLIPGVNDTEENMYNTMLLIKDAEKLRRVELLPYHRTAGAKYQMIGQEYKPQFDTNLKPRVYNVFEQQNIKTLIYD